MIANCLAIFALMNGFACLDDTATISRAEVVTMAENVGFLDEHIDDLLCVIDAESDFRTKVVSYNGSSWGLTQVHHGWWEGFGEYEAARPEWSPQVMMDAGNAIHAMKYIYDRSSWFAWDGYSIDCLGN